MPLEDEADRTVQWEAWWDAHRELFYVIPRKKFKENGGQNEGSMTKYGDQMRKMAVEALTKALKDPDRGVRLQAVIALGKVGDQRSAKAVLDTLEQDKAREVRVTSWFALGMLKDKAQMAKMTQALQNARGDEIVRTYAAIALGYAGDPQSVKVLSQVLLSRDQMGVQLGALIALGMIKHKDSAKLMGHILTTPKLHKLLRTLAAYGLGRQDPKVVAPIFTKAIQLRKDDTSVSQAIALAMGGIPGKTIVSNLRWLVVKHKDDYTRAFALLSLARQKNKKQSEFLIEGLKKAPYRIRAFVALALGIQGDKKGLKPLRAFMKKYRNNPSYYAAGAIALGLLKDKEFVPNLMKRIEKSKSREFLPYAITAAGLAGDESVASGLLEVYKKQSRYTNVRQMTTIALLKLKQDDPQKLLVEDLRDGNTFERRASAIAIGETADRGLVEVLCKELEKGDDKRVRAAAARGLGNLMDKSLNFGLTRQLAFAYNYRVTPLNRSLWHVFAIP